MNQKTTINLDYDQIEDILRSALLYELKFDIPVKLREALNITVAHFSLVGEHEDGKYDIELDASCINEL